jgi:predicted transposase/invertase (TIGR01784 family)
MTLGIKPTIDIIFKAIFGDERHSELTRSFLNDILAEIGRPKAASLQILNPFRSGRFSDDKDIVLDVRARDEQDRGFQIEMQMRCFAELPRRMLHNWASLYLATLQKGDPYASLQPLISVWILERRIFPDESWLHVFELRDAATGRILHGDLTIVTIELGAWVHLKEKALAVTVVEGVGRWLYFLGSAQDFDPERPPAGFDGGYFKEALEIMAAFTKSEAKRDIYRRRFEFYATQASIELEAKETGHAEGRAEGRAEGEAARAREDARKLKQLGVSIDIITEATGLSREDVQGL